MVSSDDHYQEVVGLCREKSYGGLVGGAGEYMVFQPPRYFSSSQLKLTYRVSIVSTFIIIIDFLSMSGTCHSYCFILFQSSLETKEYMVHELPNILDVPQDRLCLTAALLGGTIISEQSLTEFYKRIGIVQKKVCYRL